MHAAMSSGVASAVRAHAREQLCSRRDASRAAATISLRRSCPSRSSSQRASIRPSVKKHATVPRGSDTVVCRRPVGTVQPIGGEAHTPSGSRVCRPSRIGAGWPALAYVQTARRRCRRRQPPPSRSAPSCGPPARGRPAPAPHAARARPAGMHAACSASTPPASSASMPVAGDVAEDQSRPSRVPRTNTS